MKAREFMEDWAQDESNRKLLLKHERGDTLEPFERARLERILNPPEPKPEEPEVLLSPLEQLLSQWSDGYDAEEAWSAAGNRFEHKIITACVGQNPTVNGVLYRGQGVLDKDFSKIQAGKPVKIAPSKRLISSWTHDRKTAEDFARVANENHGMSSVVIAYPASELKIVADFDQFPNLRNGEHEVLCLNQPLELTSKNVLKTFLWKG